MPSYSGVWTLTAQYQAVGAGNWPDATAPIGLFGGGGIGGITNSIDKIIITTTGNATDFGDLTQAREYLGGCSSSVRGVFAGGELDPGIGLNSNVIDYVTIATVGNATDFGDLTAVTGFISGCSSSTRGLFAGGYINTNVIQYITIATTGNATDFGDLLNALYDYGACASTTRGVFAGGYVTNVIQYVTIATTGDATDFGDLPYSYKFALAGCSNAHGGL